MTSGERREDASSGPRPGQVHRRIIVVLGVVLVFLVAVTKVTSYDTWVHLSLGRWIAEEGRMPCANILSHTEPERPTVDHQWLFQLGLYRVWQAVGVSGLVIVKAVVVAAAFGLVVATALRRGAAPLATAVVVLVAVYAARFRFTLRPQVVSFVLLAAYLYVLESWRLGASRVSLLALPPLQVLWANFHGSAVIGCALPLAFAAAESLRSAASLRLRDVTPTPRPGRDLAMLWLVAIALVPLTLANPNGAAVLTEPFALSQVQRVTGLKQFLLDRSSLPWGALVGRHVFFSVLALLGLATLVVSLLRKDVTEVGLLVGLLWAALHSRRFVGLFAVAATPIIARNVSVIARTVLRRRREPREGGQPRWGHALIAVLVVFVASEAAWRALWGEQPTGLGPAKGLLPVEEVEWVQEHHPSGKLFNEWEHGGYVYWRTRRPVFLDSRGLLAYDPRLVRAYVGSWTSGERLAELVEAYDMRVALVGRSPLKVQFRADGRWVEAHEGPVCSVFVRSGDGGGPRGQRVEP